MVAFTTDVTSFPGCSAVSSPGLQKSFLGPTPGITNTKNPACTESGQARTEVLLHKDMVTSVSDAPCTEALDFWNNFVIVDGCVLLLERDEQERCEGTSYNKTTILSACLWSEVENHRTLGEKKL